MQGHKRFKNTKHVFYSQRTIVKWRNEEMKYCKLLNIHANAKKEENISNNSISKTQKENYTLF